MKICLLLILFLLAIAPLPIFAQTENIKAQSISAAQANRLKAHREHLILQLL